MIKKIVVAYDGSEPARKAFELGLDLAQKYTAEVAVLSVVRTPEVPDDVETEAIIENAAEFSEKNFEPLKKRITEMGITCSFEVRVGHPADQIVSFADEIEADLIVLGHRGRTKVGRWLLGSISKRVGSYANCSVLIAR